ncbi:hypothetical protein TrRE_jg2965, partial [Triparma retinervis]
MEDFNRADANSQNSILRLYNQNTQTLKVCEALEEGREVEQREGGGYESIYVKAPPASVDVERGSEEENLKREARRRNLEELGVYICMGKGGRNAGTPKEYFATAAGAEDRDETEGSGGQLTLEGRSRVRALFDHCSSHGWPLLVCFTGASSSTGVPES